MTQQNTPLHLSSPDEDEIASPPQADRKVLGINNVST